MLKNVLEDYLTSISEIQFFIPFKLLLEVKGFYDIHQTHGNVEFGKDFIAKKNENGKIDQYVFQLKVGDIDLNKFRSEIQPQLFEACTNTLSHPSYDKDLKLKVIFSTTGNLNQYASIAFQEFNKNVVVEKLKLFPIAVWEKDIIKRELNDIGLERFYSVQPSITRFGEFIRYYSIIKNQENLNSFDISGYTDYWSTLDWSMSFNRLQIFLEAVIFSKILMDDNKHYESLLFISSLVRTLVKNESYKKYSDEIEYYIDELLVQFLRYASNKYKNESVFTLDKEGVFQMFYHPESCLKTAELMSLYILTSKNNSTNHGTFLINLIKNTKGIFRPLSENFTISIVLISLALIKLNETELLKNYINNVVVWLCNRYKNNGISAIGSTHQEEYEQIISEHLTGINFTKKNSCFLCSAVLDICYILGDTEFYENIANDLKATEIIIEFFHVVDFHSLTTHNSKTILTSSDFDYSLAFKDNYSKIITYERTKNKIDYRDKSLFFIMFLLRDRYFPTFISELL